MRDGWGGKAGGDFISIEPLIAGGGRCFSFEITLESRSCSRHERRDLLSAGCSFRDCNRIRRCCGERFALYRTAGSSSLHAARHDASPLAVEMGSGDGCVDSTDRTYRVSGDVREADSGTGVWIVSDRFAGNRGCLRRVRSAARHRQSAAGEVRIGYRLPPSVSVKIIPIAEAGRWNSGTAVPMVLDSQKDTS